MISVSFVRGNTLATCILFDEFVSRVLVVSRAFGLYELDWEAFHELFHELLC